MASSSPNCPTRSLEEVTAEVLNNPHILCMVLKDLTLRDLLTCSLVSQAWYTLAREIIRKHKISYLDARNRSCVTLQELLDKKIGKLTSTSMPFNGLRLKMHTENIPFQTFPCVGSLILDNLEEWNLKYLEVEDRIDGDTCPLYSLIRKFCETVQVIRGETIDNTLVPLSSKKKTLDLVDRSSSVVFRLLPSCHQMQELLVHIEPYQFVDLPEHQQRAVKCLIMVECEASKKLIELQKIKEDIKLISLHMYCNIDGSTSQDFLRVCRQLIQTSEETLLELSMDIGSLQFHGIPVLRNLVRLIIVRPDLPNSPQFLTTLLSRINFSFYFPKLKQIVIRRPTCWLREYDDDQFNDNISPVYSCETVESVTFDGVRFGSSFEEWKKVFPRVKILKLHNQEMPFEEQVATVFESAWPDLQVLDIDKDHERFENDHLTNYDGLFAGLRPAETLQLQRMNADQLKSWQFAPSAPCLASFKQLKKLRIKFWILNWPMLEDPMKVCLFSKVTRELVCRRIPGLEIQLHLWHHKDDEVVQQSCLDHVKDFVNFKGFYPFWT